MKINVYEFNFIIIIAPNVIIAPINTKVNKKEEKLIINYKSLNIISNNQDNIIISLLYKNANIFFGATSMNRTWACLICSQMLYHLAKVAYFRKE